MLEILSQQHQNHAPLDAGNQHKTETENRLRTGWQATPVLWSWVNVPSTAEAALLQAAEANHTRHWV